MKKWIFVFAGLALAACSSSPKIERLPDSADATDEVRKLEKDMGDAANNHQTNVLSPRAWKEASDYLEEAKQRLSDGRQKSRILYSVAEARAWLNKADGHAEEAATVIPDVLQVRKDAIDSRAPQFASNEFNAAEKAFREYMKDRENSSSQFGIVSDKRRTFRDGYVNAQVVALQNHYLGDARHALHDARQKDARTLVPNVWENAVRSLRNAEGFIAANRNDQAGIEEQCRKATKDVAFLSRITDEAISLKELSPEQRALALDRFKRHNQNLSASLDQQAFEQKFDEARQMFSSDEAEVYKQGNRLLIRMKSIEFPVGHSALPPSSYPLITKVGNAIKSFGDSPKIRVEGHTDSRGGEKVNQKLSLERAEAVKEYLVSNAGLQPETIEVIGVRDTRPLASNKTKEGRAMNRRVDVFIMPQVQESPQIKQAQ
jgi:outer membrane protein OmpA-like peptidoglycan-associated protein